MSSYLIGINLLKAFLFGIGFAHKAFSICIGCLTIEVHYGNLGKRYVDTFSFYNEWRKK